MNLRLSLDSHLVAVPRSDNGYLFLLAPVQITTYDLIGVTAHK